jgi:hypothetical protein
MPLGFSILFFSLVSSLSGACVCVCARVCVCLPGKQASSRLHHQLGFGISFIGSVVLKQKRSISGAFFGGWKKSSRDRFFWLFLKKNWS